MVRNGYKPERNILTGIGPIEVKQSRVDDRRLEPIGKRRFSSAILPRFLCRAASIDALIPFLCLQGVSSDEFPEAHAAILGDKATAGLSASTAVRLKQSWAAEYEAWRSRDLAGKRYVYIRADGVYCNLRLKDERCCILVIIGADSSGEKEVLVVSDGFRESLIHDTRHVPRPTKEDVQKSYRLFQNAFEARYPKAVECLRKDEQAMFGFFAFPTEHRIHL